MGNILRKPKMIEACAFSSLVLFLSQKVMETANPPEYYLDWFDGPKLFSALKLLLGTDAKRAQSMILKLLLSLPGEIQIILIGFLDLFKVAEYSFLTLCLLSKLDTKLIYETLTFAENGGIRLELEIAHVIRRGAQRMRT